MLTTKLKHIRAIVLLPVMATIIIPGFIIARTGSVHRGWFLPIPFHLAPVVLGIVLFGCGLILMVPYHCLRRLDRVRLRHGTQPGSLSFAASIGMCAIP